MSFSSKVKEELAEQFPGGRHCLLAELAAISAMCGTFGADGEGEEILTIHTENEAVVRKCFTLVEKTYNIGGEVSSYTSILSNPETGSKMFYFNKDNPLVHFNDKRELNEVLCDRSRGE